MSPGAVGLVIGVGGISALVGGLVAERAARRFGVGRAIVGGLALGSGAQMIILLTRGPVAVNLAVLLLAQAADIGLAIYFINEVSLRQTITPERLLGRVNASAGFLMAGAGLVGALLGGAIGQAAGLRAALAVGLVGMLLSSLWVVFSPVRGLRELPRSVR